MKYNSYICLSQRVKNINMQPTTINIFLSSTFSDMQSERDYIRKFVVPRLNSTLNPIGIMVNVTDLRWGIDNASGSEDVREAKVLHVCMDTIRNTRPYFIAMLGERYGWIPSSRRFDNVKLRMCNVEREIISGLDSSCSVTELEIEFGAIGRHDLIEHSLFFLRSPESYKGMTIEDYKMYVLGENQTEKSRHRLNNLKNRIIKVCDEKGQQNRVVFYDAVWNQETKTFSGLEQFGERLYEMIVADVKADYDVYSQTTSPMDMELDAFIHLNATSFVGRDNILNRLERFIDGNVRKSRYDSLPLNGVVLSGVSGAGKSYLFSALYDRLVKRYSAEPHRIVLAHAAGINYKSVTIDAMLDNFRRQLAHRLGRPDTESLSNLIHEAEDKNYQLIALVDSLDSFTNDHDCFDSLIGVVPIVVTSLPDNARRFISEHSGFALYSLDDFGVEDAMDLIKHESIVNNKELPKTVVDAILGRTKQDGTPAYGSPLWTNLAVSVLMELDSDDFREIHRINAGNDSQKIETYLNKLVKDFPATPEGLFGYMINLSCRYFNEKLTKKSLLYIAMAFRGITERQLSIMMGDIWDTLEFNSLRYWLRGFIRYYGSERRLSFTHSMLKSVIINADENATKEVLNELVEYVFGQYFEGLIKIDQLIQHVIAYKEYDRFFRFLDREIWQCGGLNEYNEVSTVFYNSLCLSPVDTIDFIDKYTRRFKAVSQYEHSRAWVYDIRQKIWQREDKDSKFAVQISQLIEDLETDVFSGEQIFMGTVLDLNEYFSSEKNYDRFKWVYDRLKSLYGNDFLCSTSLYWVLTRMEEHINELSYDDMGNTAEYIRRTNNLLDEIDIFIDKIPLGNEKLIDSLIRVQECISSPFNALLNDEEYIELSKRIHSIYINLYPEDDSGYQFNDFIKGANSLLYNYQNSHNWIHLPETELTRHFGGDNVTAIPSRISREPQCMVQLPVVDNDLKLKYAVEFDETFGNGDLQQLSDSVNARIGIVNPVSQAKMYSLMGIDDMVTEVINEGMSLNEPRGITVDAIGELRKIIDYLGANNLNTLKLGFCKPILPSVLHELLLGNDDAFEILDKYELFLLNEGQIQNALSLMELQAKILYYKQIDDKFLYDNEDYGRGNYTDLTTSAPLFCRLISLQRQLGDTEGLKRVESLWKDMFDMTYQDSMLHCRDEKYPDILEDIINGEVPSIHNNQFIADKIIDSYKQKMTNIGADDIDNIRIRHLKYTAGGSRFIATLIYGYSNVDTVLTDLSGNILSKVDRYKFIIDFYGKSLTHAGENGAWTFINHNGVELFDLKFRSVRPYSEGYAAVAKHARTSFPFQFYWGYINEQGNYITGEDEFMAAWDFHCLRAKVMIEGKIGFIDTKGSVVIEPKYDAATSFNNGYALAFIGNEMKWIDVDGNEMS